MAFRMTSFLYKNGAKNFLMRVFVRHSGHVLPLKSLFLHTKHDGARKTNDLVQGSHKKLPSFRQDTQNLGKRRSKIKFFARVIAVSMTKTRLSTQKERVYMRAKSTELWYYK